MNYQICMLCVIIITISSQSFAASERKIKYVENMAGSYCGKSYEESMRIKVVRNTNKSNFDLNKGFRSKVGSITIINRDLDNKAPVSVKQINRIIKNQCSHKRLQDELYGFVESSSARLSLVMCYTPIRDLFVRGSYEERKIKAKNLNEDCINYYKTTFFKDSIENIRNKNRKAKLIKEQKRKKKEKKENARIELVRQSDKKAESLFVNALSEDKSDINQVIWGSIESNGGISNSEGDRLDSKPIKYALKDINLESWEETGKELTRLKKSTTKTIKKKITIKRGEFEKTADYNKRKSVATNKMNKGYEELIASKNKKYKIAKDNNKIVFKPIFKRKMIAQLGVSTFTLTYDKNKKFNIVKVTSEGVKGYHVSGVIYRNNNEKNRDDITLSGDTKAFIIYDLGDDTLAVERAFLKSGGSIYKLFRVEDNLDEIDLDEYGLTQEEADKYHPILEARLEKERIATEKAANEARKQARIRAQAEEKAAAKRRIARKKERSDWPKNAVAKIKRGSIFCLSWKSAYKASVLINNPYVSLPDDCALTPSMGFAISVNHMNGGVARILTVGGSDYGYIPSSSLTE